MQKWKISLVAAFLAAASLAQVSSGLMTPDVKRVGMRLACLCKGCTNTVGDCPMIDCGYSSPARKKIAAMLAAGKDDDTIVDAFVQEEGKLALAIPPKEGFSLLAWWMPSAALAFGLGAVWMALQRMRKPKTAAPEMDPAVLARYHDQIEKDLIKYD